MTKVEAISSINALDKVVHDLQLEIFEHERLWERLQVIRAELVICRAMLQSDSTRNG